MNVNMSIGPHVLKVTPRLDSDQYEKVKEGSRYRVEGYQFTKYHIQFGWDGYKYPFKRSQVAPSGLHRRVAKLLVGEGHKVIPRFVNDYKPRGKLFVYGLDLDNFQKHMTKKLVKHRICIGSAPVRAGKTAVFGSAINLIDHYPVCIITEGRDLVKQTRQDIADYTGKKVGFLSESKFSVGEIWVTSYAAMRSVISWITDPRATKELKRRNKKILQLAKNTKVLLLDECHHALSPESQKVLKKFKSIGYKIGLSSTPKPDDLSMVEVESVIGPVISRIKFKSLIDSKRLAKPIIHIYDLPDTWFSDYLHEFSDIYEGNITNNRYRNRLIAEIVKKLKEFGKSSFVMVSIKQHGRNLREMIPGSFFVHGQTATDTRFELYDALQKGTLHCIITTVGKVGLNLPKLDAVINAEGMKSKVMTVQKMRSLTAHEDKKAGLVIDFLDKGAILEKHSNIRLKKYSGIKGFTIKRKTVPENHFEN